MNTFRRHVVWLCTLLICGTIAAAEPKDRKPAVAGAFYPADREKLRESVYSFLEEADGESLEGKIAGLISPHAGYVYSGPVAAHAYGQLRGRNYDTVVLMGPCHRGKPFTGVSVGAYEAYETPLGRVPVDRKLAQELMDADDLIRFLPDRHAGEHSLEVQLPFLQAVLEDFNILPVLTGDFSLNTCRTVAKCLNQATKDRNVLFIASTDLSHYLPYEEAVALDRQTVDAVVKGRARPLYYGLLNQKYSMCGRTAVVMLLMTLAERGPFEARLQEYANSGDTAGTKDRVVGYGAFAFLESGEEPPAESKDPEVQSGWKLLGPDSRRRLLALARSSIREYLTHKRLPEVDPADYPECRGSRGVFVTLYKDGQLRGCIGCHASRVSLCRIVPYMAVRSACADPRFGPLKLSELDEVTIEINVYLTPLIPVDGPEAFKPGEDGIQIVKGHRSATYLPKVASEQGWSREETLGHLCRKAGLPDDAWRGDDVEFYIYKTQCFAEGADETL